MRWLFVEIIFLALKWLGGLIDRLFLEDCYESGC